MRKVDPLDLTTEGGLSTGELAHTAFRAFCEAWCGAEGSATGELNWDSLEEAVQDAWGMVALTALRFDENGMFGPVEEIALALIQAYDTALGLPPKTTTAGMCRAERIAWCAVSRHLAHLTSDADANESVGDLERSWRQWAANARTPQ
jgi:hypothetical protein